MDHKERDEWIKDRAYSLWEMSGREHGRDQEHWQRAQQEWQDRQVSRSDTGARPPTEEEKAAIQARLSSGSNEPSVGSHAALVRGRLDDCQR